MNGFDAFLSSLKTVTATALINTALTFIIGWVAVKYVCKLLKKLMSRSSLDPSLKNLALQIIRSVLYFILIISCADRLNLPVTSLITLLGALGLAVSLALQDSLANLAGGIFVIWTKPFSTGDFIEVGGVSGTVASIGFIHTVLNTIDNCRIYIPNGSVSKDKIINYSAEENRRVELTFPVAYESDLPRARQVILDAVLQDERVLRDPAPFVRVWSLGASSVDIMARVWTRNQDFIELKCDLLEQVKQALDRSGISIPYSRLDVTITQPHQS